MRRLQREWAEVREGGVIEGRDIGTVVFPDAALKVYLTARPDVRAQRRAAEVGEADEATIAQWAANLAERDHLDSTRADSPLREASDATVIDTSDRSIDEVVEDIVGRLP
jgi:cytidylate kinase